MKEHTTDLYLIAYGHSFESALIELIKAFLSHIHIKKKKNLKEKFHIILDGKKDEIVVKLLNELLYLMETEDKIIENINNIKYSNGKLNVEFYINKGEVETEIKSATYHDLKVEHKNNGWSIRVLLDI